MVVADTPFDKGKKAFHGFFEGEDENGPESAEFLQCMLNNALSKKPIEDYIKQVIEKHPRPGNVDHLVSPKTNPVVYAGLQRGSLIVDSAR